MALAGRDLHSRGPVEECHPSVLLFFKDLKIPDEQQAGQSQLELTNHGMMPVIFFFVNLGCF